MHHLQGGHEKMSLDDNGLLKQQKIDKMDSPLDYLAINYETYCNEI